MANEKIKSALGIIFIIVLFILASYIVQNNLNFIKNYIRSDFIGMVVYILILVVSAVIAPIDVVFLMPVATAVWGWVGAALLSLLGWTLGSAVVFVLARKYGAPLIRKLVPLEKIHEYEKLMPKENIFLEIVFLRMTIPVDVVSYTIGLLTNVKFMPYFFATLIGFLPLALFLAYAGTLPAYIQLIGFIIFLLIVALGLLLTRYRKSKRLRRRKSAK